MKREITGDLIKLALQGEFDIIVHGCNCFNTMNSGIAKQIKKIFPEAYRADLGTIKGDPSKLGTFSYAKVNMSGKDLLIYNAYTQFTYGGPKEVSYEALDRVFAEIGAMARLGTQSVGYPKIGAGLGGGDWSVISQIIDRNLIDVDHTFVKYEK